MARKRCNGCGEDKPLDEFYKLRGKPNGRCKPCVRAQVTARRWSKVEEIRAKDRARYYAKREIVLARMKKRYDEDEAYRQREIDRAWAHRNDNKADPAWVAHRKAICRKFDTSPKGRAANCNSAQKRRAQLLAVFVEDVDRRLVLERHDGLCGICGESVDPENFHLDHITPLARGGEHSYANTQPAHPVCNLKKGARVVALESGD